MIGIVIATHCGIASALAQAAEVVVGNQDGLCAVDLAPEADRAVAWGLLRDGVAQVDRGDGVLVLVDMLGGTPSNLAMALLAQGGVEVVTGVNLPMVLRSLTGRVAMPGSLQSLAADVVRYGRRNVTGASEWLAPGEAAAKVAAAKAAPKTTAPRTEGEA